MPPNLSTVSLDGRVDRRLVCNVEANRIAPAAKFPRGFLRTFQIDVGNHHMGGAFTYVSLSERPANAARRTRDECRLACQSVHFKLPIISNCLAVRIEAMQPRRLLA